MKKNLVKRFFVEEEGMETMQVVMIAVIAAVIATGVFAVWKNNMKDNVEKAAATITDPSGVSSSTNN